MAQYTTGEMAKLCGVSVRTVQYYDSRGILVPSQLSEGGRRLYSDGDLKRMKIICFLRSLNFSINSILEIIESNESERVISELIKEQKKILEGEVDERKQKLKLLEDTERELKGIEDLSFDSMGDVAQLVNNRKRLRGVHIVIVALGVVVDLIELFMLFMWIRSGTWLYFAIGLPIVIAMTFFAMWFYYRSVQYICPCCHSVFKPKFWEFFFANHNIRARKVTCTCCNKRSFCVETAGQKRQ